MDKNTTIVEAFNSATVGQVETVVSNIITVMLIIAIILFVTTMFSKPRF